MSRRSPRIRVRFTATVSFPDSTDLLVCRTRDISDVGMYLDTAQPIAEGTRLEISLMDQMRGIAIEVSGVVARNLQRDEQAGPAHGIGVQIDAPPPEWTDLVESYQQNTGDIDTKKKRLRVLVIGDERRRRGALALYVTSGWDVRFACDLDAAIEALKSVSLNAVITEEAKLSDRWDDVLVAARELQPNARRIKRGSTAPIDGSEGEVGMRPLVHRYVERDAGLDALLDAIAADLGPNVPSSSTL